MLQYETCLFCKNNKIVQRVAIENCTASVERINKTLKQFPFNAYVIREGNGQDKRTVIYIHLDHEVLLKTVDILANIIESIVEACQEISETLKAFENTIKALVKDCKPFEDEKSESNSSTTEEVSDC